MPPSVDVDEDVNARVPLSRRRVVRAAVALADGEGIGAVTMRRLAQELEVEAMSLYHHVANKEAVLDGAMELVAEEILDAVGGIGALAWRSGYVPAIVGVLVAVAGIGYTADGLLAVLLGAGAPQLSVFLFGGEVLLAGWLLWRGRRIGETGRLRSAG